MTHFIEWVILKWNGSLLFFISLFIMRKNFCLFKNFLITEYSPRFDIYAKEQNLHQFADNGSSWEHEYIRYPQKMFHVRVDENIHI